MDQLEFDRTLARRRKRRRALLVLLLSTSLATLGAGAMSLAIFTDSDASTGSWTAGTIVLGVSPATTFTATDIMPGDSGSQTVTVANTGTGDLRYAMTVAATNADGQGLAAQLDLTIEAGSCASPGATLYSGKLDVAALGDNTPGGDAGDRTVLGGASDDLCFTWGFPLASGNGFQAAATSATFTFDGEQTANNP
jgi:hypothetical protein